MFVINLRLTKEVTTVTVFSLTGRRTQSAFFLQMLQHCSPLLRLSNAKVKPTCLLVFQSARGRKASRGNHRTDPFGRLAPLAFSVLRQNVA